MMTLKKKKISTIETVRVPAEYTIADDRFLPEMPGKISNGVLHSHDETNQRQIKYFDDPRLQKKKEASNDNAWQYVTQAWSYL